jgi:hypothetical protein
MRIMSKKQFFLSVVVGLGVSVGCARYQTGEANGDLAPARLFFTNESLDEATVYALSGGQQIRIGTVMGGRTDTLVVPPTLLSSGTVRLIARPLARNGVASSGPFPMHAGDDMSVRLPSTQLTLVVLPPPG